MRSQVICKKHSRCFYHIIAANCVFNALSGEDQAKKGVMLPHDQGTCKAIDGGNGAVKEGFPALS